MANEEKSYKEWIDQQKGNFPYWNPAPLGEDNKEQFPIVASDVWYDNFDKVIKPEYLALLKEANFTIGMQSSLTSTEVCPSLESTEKVPVGLMFFSSVLIDNKDTLKKAMGYPCFSGFKLRDEPSYREITGIDCPIDPENKPPTMQDQYRKLLSDNDGKNPFIYINLLPSLDDDTKKCIGGEKDKEYFVYLDAYQEYFKPSFFCYDFYPITEKSDLIFEGISSNNSSESGYEEGVLEVKTDAFFNALKLFYDLGKSHNRPFWAFCESNCFMKIEDSSFRGLVKEPYLRFEAFCSLANGVKGLVYWTYASQKSDSTSDEICLSALLNRRNEKTASWYYAQQVNAEIQRYKDIFLKAELKETINAEEYSYESGRASVQFICDIEKSVQIARFADGNITYIVVVCKDPFKNYFNLTINVERGVVNEVTPIKSNGETNSILLGTTNRIMVPGGYRIFRIFDPL